VARSEEEFESDARPSTAALKIFVDMRTQCDLLQDFSFTPVRPLLSAPAVTLSTFTFLIADERR